MDIISVLFILCVSVAGTAFMTWVPAYRKGVRSGHSRGWRAGLTHAAHRLGNSQMISEGEVKAGLLAYANPKNKREHF